MSQTILSIYNKFVPLIGKSHHLPITKNKGLPGQFLEDLLGIPHTSNCLDCSDGELKIFPVKKLKNGAYAPKESIAVTMLSKEDLCNNDFKASKCYKKISRMLVVPYFRSCDSICFMDPQIIDKDNPDYYKLYDIIECDYNLIRKQYLEKEILQSSDGVLLQNRTKGPGHGSVSRAFYLRPEFMKQYIRINL
jgi:DNA mismatch repair protein MutH